MSEAKGPPLLSLTAQIVAAHVGANIVDATAVPRLIEKVYGALANPGKSSPLGVASRQPAVPVKHSVFPEYIICLEDGKKLKVLRRYLARCFGLTPYEYRKKWGLPESYPMVAPAHAARRSMLAKKTGLGKRSAARTVEVQKIPERKRGPRRTKAAS